jgi:tRNA(adenine34) deaminase
MALPTKQEQELYMKQALNEAHKALDQDEVPIGAVVVSHGMVIGRGYNQVETLTDVTAHAEMIAITSASQYMGSKYLKDCTLYVTLEPCNMCATAIGWAQIPFVVYGAGDPKKGYTVYNAPVMHPKAKVIRGVMEDECSELLTEFFKKLRE